MSSKRFHSTLLGIFCSLAAFCGAVAAQPANFEFVSVSTMDDRQLQESAAFIRKNAQPTDHCLLNMMWLMTEADHYFEVQSPVRLLRDRMERYWDDRSLTGPDFNLDNVPLRVNRVSSYRLSLGGERLAIQYRYKF